MIYLLSLVSYQKRAQDGGSRPDTCAFATDKGQIVGSVTDPGHSAGCSNITSGTVDHRAATRFKKSVTTTDICPLRGKISVPAPDNRPTRTAGGCLRNNISAVSPKDGGKKLLRHRVLRTADVQG